MFKVLSFYAFYPLGEEGCRVAGQTLKEKCTELVVQGLIVLAPEGVNATVAGEPAALSNFRQFLEESKIFGALPFKESETERKPFRRLKIDIRPEIVTLGAATCSSEEMAKTLLSPAQWHERLKARSGGEDDPIVIDVRNRYETAIGKFKGAVDPSTTSFTEFPEFLKKAGVPKDKELLMYCTGGIRCEKVMGLMRKEGYTRARQLSGGILKYLEEFPEGEFEGECFVFDHRVAVDGHLRPTTKYSLCAHCGDPGDKKITCRNCATEKVVCEKCLEQPDRHSCSKNCAYHLRRKSPAVAACS